MTKFSKSHLLLAAFALSGAAAANGDTAYYGQATSSVRTCPTPVLAGTRARNFLLHPNFRHAISGGPSDTAWFFHRRGAKHFERQKFDAAEKAFEASLRAKGRSLKKETLLYLAHIAIETGDKGKAERYAEAYARESGKEFVSK